jgi:hypothetical protein
MSLKKGSILEQLHSYGLLDTYITDVAAAPANKKKAILARRQIHWQVRQPKYQEHPRNDIWMHHLEKVRERMDSLLRDTT